MAAYNDARFIEAAMRSVLAQASRPFTFIVSDDASTDGTADLAEAVARSYTGPHTVRVIRQPVNLGPVHHGIERYERQTDAEVVVNASADDLHPPQRVARLLAALERTGADLVCSNAAWIDSNGGFLRPHVRDRPSGPVTLDEILEAGWCRATLGATFAMRRSLWVDTGGFRDTVIPSGADLWLPLRAALRGGCHYLAEPLLLWRQHDRQVKRLTTDERVGKAVSGEAHRVVLLSVRLQQYRELMADRRPAVRARAPSLLGPLLSETAAWVAHRQRNRDEGFAPQWVPLRALLTGGVAEAPAASVAEIQAAERSADAVAVAVAPLLVPGRTRPASGAEVQAVFDALTTCCVQRKRLVRAHLRPVWRAVPAG